MRTIAFFLVFAGLVATAGAQDDYLPTPEDLAHFKSTKTYVVLEASPMSDFNFEIKDVMPKVWGVTEFEFIKQEEFARLSSDESKSFLYTSIVSFERDKTDSRYVFLHLSLGGENISIDDLRDLVSVPLGYYGVAPENYIYKLGIMLKFMQNHIQLISENPDIISNNVFKHYNDNIEDAQVKTVYFVEDEMEKEISTPARIKKIYPYKFELVDREKIRQAIHDQDDDVVFMHKVGPEGRRSKARCYKILIGAGDARFYYFDYHMVNKKRPDGFLESDLKKLAR